MQTCQSLSSLPVRTSWDEPWSHALGSASFLYIQALGGLHLYLVIFIGVRHPESWEWLLAKLKRTGAVPRLGQVGGGLEHEVHKACLHQGLDHRVSGRRDRVQDAGLGNSCSQALHSCIKMQQQDVVRMKHSRILKTLHCGHLEANKQVTDTLSNIHSKHSRWNNSNGFLAIQCLQHNRGWVGWWAQQHSPLLCA